MGRLCSGPRGASPASPRAVMQARAGASAEAKGQAGEPANVSPPVDMTCLLRGAKLLRSKNAACSQRSGCPCPQRCRAGGCCGQPGWPTGTGTGPGLGAGASWLPPPCRMASLILREGPERGGGNVKCRPAPDPPHGTPGHLQVLLRDLLPCPNPSPSITRGSVSAGPVTRRGDSR